jgi:glycosidase
MLPLLLSAALAGEPAPDGIVHDGIVHDGIVHDGIVYFVLVDRFDNGDPDNDDTIDVTDPQAFHGGDLAGVTRRLPYLHDLGVRTIWLSPVFTMRTEKFHGHGAFHGYWVEDLGSIEPRFGGEAALVALAEAAEALGIRLILDMVYNHTAFDAPLVTSHPDWFHDDGGIEDWNDPVQLVRGRVHGLPDLAQERPEVYDYLLQQSLRWGRTLSADGFRIDAVRHMSDDFFHALSADLKAELGADFWLLGEDFEGDARQLSQTFRAGGFDAMFDFPLRYALVDVVCHGAHPGRLASTLALDDLYDNPAGLVTFLDNHDLPRIASECGGDRGRVGVALLTLFALRGTPAITYGTEWLLEGPGEPENRADMPWEGRGPLADTLADLAALRAANPWLADATVTVEALDAEVLRLRLIGSGKSARLIVNLSASTTVMAAGSGVRIGADAALTAADGTVPPGAAALLLDDDAAATAEPVAVRLRVRAPGRLPRGERMVLVGAGEALGSWDPAQGVALPATITLPAGSVMAYKLVRIDADGAAHWEQTDNRYTLVAPGLKRIEARWEELR